MNLSELLRGVVVVVMVVFAAASASSSSGSKAPKFDPNAHVYFSPLFASAGPGWTSPKWNIALGLDPQHVVVTEDSENGFSIKATRGQESLLFILKIDTGSPDELINAEIATFHRLPDAKVDQVHNQTWNKNRGMQLLGEPTAGYSGHVNASKLDQYLSRRGRCVFSVLIAKPGEANDFSIANFSDEVLRLRIRSINAALGAGGALCEPGAGPARSSDPSKDAAAAALAAAIQGVYFYAEGARHFYIRLEPTGVACFITVDGAAPDIAAVPRCDALPARAPFRIGPDSIISFVHDGTEYRAQRVGNQLQVHWLRRGGADRKEGDKLYSLLQPAPAP